jgi:hypothetical protein
VAARPQARRAAATKSRRLTQPTVAEELTGIDETAKVQVLRAARAMALNATFHFETLSRLFQESLARRQ